jgi:hypothetical protein
VTVLLEALGAEQFGADRRLGRVVRADQQATRVLAERAEPAVAAS